MTPASQAVMGSSEDVVRAVKAAVPGLRQAAHGKSPCALRERDLQSALQNATGALPASLRLQRWPGVGPLDLRLPDGIGLELKWAVSGDTLCNCAWDIAKLATGIAAGEIESGFLVAGAPQLHWTSRAPGTELLESAVYPDPAIVNEYESWWRFWCRDVKTQPQALPRLIETIEVARVKVALGSEPFSICITEVRVPDRAWVDYVCPHRARGEPCRER